jgi:DNA-binding GntR family transcriptional regulator
LNTKPDDPRTWTTRDHRAYVSLFAMLRDRIETNYYTPGKRIPCISELRIETGLSRQTVGRAPRFLEREGLAVRAAGLGYFVTDQTTEGNPRTLCVPAGVGLTQSCLPACGPGN